LTIREIAFESINVLEDASGMTALRELGARSIPVVSKGAKFVFAQVLQDVVDFLGIDDDTGPKLSPTELAERYTGILDKAVQLVAQMPDDQLDKELPNRPRSWRVLMHHVFQIPTAFMDSEAQAKQLTYEDLVTAPPEDMHTSADIAAFGESVKVRFGQWWETASGDDFSARVNPYFGETSRHELLERTVWHSTQHVRQVASLVERAGQTPVTPMTSADIEGLPLTDRIWDE
jgi:hypothetical protein